jgi:hypothetical protein
MKLFLLVLAFLAVAFQGCKTCPMDTVITEALVETFAGHADCAGADAMRSTITPVVSTLAFCSADYDTQAAARVLPDGAWSAAGGACFVTARKLKDQLGGKYPPEWRCGKSAFPEAALAQKCQELE